MNTITIDRAIVEQALEALKAALSDDQPYIERCRSAEAALRAALAEPEQLPSAQPITEAMMDVVDRLGSEYDQVDPRAWDHMLVYAPNASAAQEPFCYHDGRDIVGKEYAHHSDVFPLYTAPAKGESEGLVGAQVVYQISMKNGATSSAWIDVDEAAYNSAKVYGEYKCRCLYTAPPQRKPLTDEELRLCFTGTNTAEPFSEGWSGLERFARAIERAHGIGDV